MTGTSDRGFWLERCEVRGTRGRDSAPTSAHPLPSPPRSSASSSSSLVAHRSSLVADRSPIFAETDADFEARLAALKKAKGETPYGESKSKDASSSSSSSSSAKESLPVRDYTGETLHFESGPHMGDLAVNVALGTTLVWLPLSIAAVGRAAFVKYRFTDRRLSTITTAPWKNEQLDAAYEDVVDVRSVGRGVGYWGDMVVELKNGDKVEMRALPKFRELQAYILERRDALKSAGSKGNGKVKSPGGGGF